MKNLNPYLYHTFGKIGLSLCAEITTQQDLALAYTPGVARPCLALERNKALTHAFTARGNLVAVMTDGTAVLGLGNIGAAASIPVMEGKCALFKQFAGVDAWPVPLEIAPDSVTGKTDVEAFIKTAKALAPMYGGINLEDIAAPACFEIEERLEAELDIPVFHDDQWGTAIITLAAVKNYLLISNKKIENTAIVINGAGAAGIRIADMLKAAGAENITLVDSRGVITTDRSSFTVHKKRFARNDRGKTLTSALAGADIFIGVSVGGCVSGEMIQKMNEYPAIFALANPEPEIKPALVREALGSKPYVMATGRSDFPNQINNVLGFPFLFRGALDCGAVSITTAMKIAAAEALAALARAGDIPSEVKNAYNRDFCFGPDYIIPTPFDPRICHKVSPAVSRCALKEKVSRYSAAFNDYNSSSGSTVLRASVSAPGYDVGFFIRFTDGKEEYALYPAATLIVKNTDGSEHRFADNTLNLRKLYAVLAEYTEAVGRCIIKTTNGERAALNKGDRRITEILPE